jgi:hypothetical protein
MHFSQFLTLVLSTPLATMLIAHACRSLLRSAQVCEDADDERIWRYLFDPSPRALNLGALVRRERKATSAILIPTTIRNPRASAFHLPLPLQSSPGPCDLSCCLWGSRFLSSTKSEHHSSGQSFVKSPCWCSRRTPMCPAAFLSSNSAPFANQFQ